MMPLQTGIKDNLPNRVASFRSRLLVHSIPLLVHEYVVFGWLAYQCIRTESVGVTKSDPPLSWFHTASFESGDARKMRTLWRNRRRRWTGFDDGLREVVHPGLEFRIYFRIGNNLPLGIQGGWCGMADGAFGWPGHFCGEDMLAN